MGYYSQVTIGMEKQYYVESALITQALPKLLVQEKAIATTDAVYWTFEAIKWYESYPYIQECETYFETLKKAQLNNNYPIFGAIRIGEDSHDYEEWGHPYSFDICTSRLITSPVT